MIEGWKELYYIKYKSASDQAFSLSCLNKIIEVNSCINRKPLFWTIHLIRVKEAQQNSLELESFTNEFFNYLVKYIE